MADIGAPGAGTAVPIGEVSAPPFARAPDPAATFRPRAARYRRLAEGHDLGPYLAFLADLAEVQEAVARDLQPPAVPPADALARAREFGMPALDRATLAGDGFAEAMRRFLDGAGAVAMPEEARRALVALRAREEDERAWMAGNVLDSAVPFEAMAEHLFVAAGMQVNAVLAAARLDSAGLVPVGEGVCPACGSPPVSSLIVGWHGAHGARFCACSLCGTLWNMVRVRCTSCGSTKDISYKELDGGDGTVRAECCGQCRTQLKTMHQAKNPELEPFADDVATAALDVLVREEGFQRSGANPFLLGY